MEKMKFNKELYSKIALIKASYNYTDRYYVHLDADEKYYYVSLETKSDNFDESFSEQDFINEMLAQSARHEVYKQTKDIRELLLARAMSTSMVTDGTEDASLSDEETDYNEDEILKDWFSKND